MPDRQTDHAEMGTREAPLTAPWHYWAVALISLLWTAIGAYDYTMTHLGDAEYLAGYPEEQRAYLASLPPALVAFWALGVWASFVGSICLLLKSRFAVPAFGLALLGLVCDTFYRQTGPLAESMRTPVTLGFTVVIWAVLLFFLWYAVHMRRARVLA